MIFCVPLFWETYLFFSFMPITCEIAIDVYLQTNVSTHNADIPCLAVISIFANVNEM